MTLRDEIHQQPRVIERLVGSDSPAIQAVEAVARAVEAAGIEHVVIAARGTSDHAAIYAQYLLGIRLRLPVALAAPSILTLYGVEPRFGRSLVIGISQSGASPDVVSVVDAGRRQGAVTLAITNDPASPLARAAAHVLDLATGPELAVAATKTYTASLAAIAMLASALGGDPPATGLEALPDAMAQALATEPDTEAAAHSMAPMPGCMILGRGYEYATTREWALKLKELAQVVADPYSAADFRHGPLALAEPGFPVLAVAPSGAVAEDLVALLEQLRDEHDVDLLVLSDREEVRALGRHAITLPAGLPDHLAPIPSIVPAQLFALHLTRARGLDPDRPRHIAKVTRTR
jgi:glutamine---fructose-6-phosphate transaminase (isomerizing)